MEMIENGNGGDRGGGGGGGGGSDVRIYMVEHIV